MTIGPRGLETNVNLYGACIRETPYFEAEECPMTDCWRS